MAPVDEATDSSDEMDESEPEMDAERPGDRMLDSVSPPYCTQLTFDERIKLILSDSCWLPLGAQLDVVLVPVALVVLTQGSEIGERRSRESTGERTADSERSRGAWD